MQRLASPLSFTTHLAQQDCTACLCCCCCCRPAVAATTPGPADDHPTGACRALRSQTAASIIWRLGLSSSSNACSELEETQDCRSFCFGLVVVLCQWRC